MAPTNQCTVSFCNKRVNLLRLVTLSCCRGACCNMWSSCQLVSAKLCKVRVSGVYGTEFVERLGWIKSLIKEFQILFFSINCLYWAFDTYVLYSSRYFPVIRTNLGLLTALHTLLFLWYPLYYVKLVSVNGSWFWSSTAKSQPILRFKCKKKKWFSAWCQMQMCEMQRTDIRLILCNHLVMAVCSREGETTSRRHS